MLQGALIVLGVLAATGVLASEMPRGAAWLLAVAALVHGLHSAARQRSKAPIAVDWDGHAGLVRVDGRVVDSPALQWRGLLAFLSWRDAHGRVRRLAWWPDTLPRAARRELRLAASPMTAAPGAGGVAP